MRSEFCIPRLNPLGPTVGSPSEANRFLEAVIDQGISGSGGCG